MPRFRCFALPISFPVNLTWVDRPFCKGCQMLNFFDHIQTGFILSKQTFALDYKMAREMSVAKILTWAHFKIQTWIKSWGWVVKKWFSWAGLHLACYFLLLLRERWGGFLGRDRCLGRVFWCLSKPLLSDPGGVISKRLGFFQRLVTRYGFKPLMLSSQSAETSPDCR